MNFFKILKNINPYVESRTHFIIILFYFCTILNSLIIVNNEIFIFVKFKKKNNSYVECWSHLIIKKNNSLDN